MKHLLFAVLIVSAAVATYGQTVSPALVEATGQSGCFDTDGNSRPCAGTGEDGEYQSGVPLPTSRFADRGDGTVNDNLTGLIWLKDANCPGGVLTWQQALDWVKNPLNSGGTACGGYAAGTFADWRLPNIKELLSLVDYGQSSPALPAGHPFVNVQWGEYWSSSSSAENPFSAWRVDIRGGNDNDLNKSATAPVWPVRGGVISVSGFEPEYFGEWVFYPAPGP